MLATVTWQSLGTPGYRGRVELRLLGPVQLVIDGRSLPLGRRQERCLLATLALWPGRLVSVERLTDLLWGEQPPRQSRGAVQAAVSHLRSALRPAQRHGVELVSGVGGYALHIDPDLVDVHRFRSLVERGRCSPSGKERVEWLTAALRLWSGPALAGAATDEQRERLCPDLRELRVAAREDLLRARLDLGEHHELIDELTVVVAEHPLRERPYGLLMLALYRCGRRADALDVYQRARRMLVDELGLDPGPELAELERAVLTDDPTLLAPTRPADGAAAPVQLPADLIGFTGRVPQLKELDGLLDRTHAGSTARHGADAVVITALAGTAGIGKTTLAVHWAHRVADRFPDGQLYVNLRGFHPTMESMDPAEAVRSFLDALGVPTTRLPAGPDAQAALYRTRLAGRRMLILLDNARDAEQVRPLLPGAPGCLVVVTSRNQLTSLVATQDAQLMVLDLLSPDEARELLVRRLGPDRVAAEPEAADQIVVRCARLPLALAVTAARAASHPDFPLAVVADELADAGTRLDTLADADPVSNVRAVFSWSYRTLSARAARMFRLFSLVPGPDLGMLAAASLAGMPRGQVRLVLAELTRAHLVAEPVPGRYVCHDLLRDYAAELAATEDPAFRRRAATRRLLDHYLHSAYAAAVRLEPHRQPIALPPPAKGVTPELPPDRDHAFGWLAAEQAGLLAALTTAGPAGFDTHVGPLAWTLTDFLQRRVQWRDQLAVHRVALAAAGRMEDRHGEARAHRNLGRAYTLLDRPEEAEAHYRHALDISGLLGDLNGQAHTHLNLANVHDQARRAELALEHARQALDLFTSAGDRSGVARALNSMGWSYSQLGNHRVALAHCRRAIDLLQELGDVHGQAYTWDSLGYAHRHLGEHIEAIACYRRAIALFVDQGDRFYEAMAHTHLGDACHAAGDENAARQAWQRAAAMLDEVGHPAADEVRARLAR